MSRRRASAFIAVVVAAGVVAWLCFAPAAPELVYAAPAGVPLHVDIVYPSGPGPHPVVIFAPHRGDWAASYKGDERCRQMVAALTGRGYAVATGNYRIVGEHRFPSQIEDGKAGVQWVRANAARLGLSADRIGIVGVSAGGYGACMLGTTGPGDGFDLPGADPGASRVQAVVAIGAPADLTVPLSPFLERQYLRPFLGAGQGDDPSLYARASPGTYATLDDPPFLLIHSAGDVLVPVALPRAFAAKLRRAGVPVELVEEEGATHVWGGARLDRTLERVGAFLDEHLRR